MNKATKREDIAVDETSANTLHAMSESVALLDTGGVIRDVNPAFLRLTDYDRENIEGRDIREMLPEIFDEERATVEENFERVQLKRDKEDPDDALSITSGRGRQRWVVPSLVNVYGRNNEPLGMALTLRDVTGLIAAREKLRESERRYRELVENANSIIMRITPGHYIKFLNDYALQFFGYNAEEVIGKHVVGTIAPEIDSDGRDLRRLMLRITAQPELHASNVNENMQRDGRRVWVHWSNRAIRDEQGVLREILCVGTDVTEQKQLEQKAAQYRERLRSLANQLTATEERERRRVSVYVHDTVIQTLSLANMRIGAMRRTLEREGRDDLLTEIDRVGGMVRQGVAECRSLMSDLAPPLLYELGLGPALEDFAEKQQGIHKVPITVLEQNPCPDLDDSRRGLLFQCTRELVFNALKHASPSRINVGVTTDNRAVLLEVSDDGRGFDPATLHSGEADDEGGFGLFNIRERLQGFGGRLELSSSPGGGTVAAVRLPVEDK